MTIAEIKELINIVTESGVADDKPDAAKGTPSPPAPAKPEPATGTR